MLQAHEHIYCMLYMCIFPHVSNEILAIAIFLQQQENSFVDHSPLGRIGYIFMRPVITTCKRPLTLGLLTVDISSQK